MEIGERKTCPPNTPSGPWRKDKEIMPKHESKTGNGERSWESFENPQME